jgi:hypothetical protein
MKTQALSGQASLRVPPIESNCADGNHLAQKREFVQKFRAIAAQIGDKPRRLG